MQWKRLFVGSAVVAVLAASTAIILRITSDLAAADPAQQTAMCTLRVTGITCAGCAVAVKIAASKVDGVTDVNVSHEQKRAQVTYDPAKTTPSAIAKAITEGSGFKAELQSAIQN